MGVPDGVDLTVLSDALAAEYPVATLYADLRQPERQRDAVIATRHEPAFKALAASGCPPAVINSLRTAVADSAGASESGMWVAGDAGVLAHIPLDREVPVISAFGVPHLAPLILHTPEPMSAAVVLLDSRQAQIHVLRDGLSAQRLTMSGRSARGHAIDLIEQILAPADLYARKTAAAGWFGFDQKQRDHGVENAWIAHARTVATSVRARFTPGSVDAVVIAGDPHHRAALADLLRSELTMPVQVVEGGGPAPWRDVSAVADAALVELAILRTKHRAALLETWQESMHPRHATARQGLVTTLAAIREQRVSDLLLTRDAPLETRGVVGHEPWLIGMDPAEINAYAPSQIHAGPVVDLAIRAVALTGGQVHALTALPPAAQGMAALMRWP